MKRLLYITTNINNSGGVAKVLSVKLNYLVSKGYEIHVLNSNGAFNNTFFDFDDRIQFHFIGNKSFKLLQLNRYGKELNSVIESIKPHVIINTDNGLKGSLLPYLVKKDISLIYERHCSKNMKFNSWSEALKFRFSNVLTKRSIAKYKQFIVLNNSHFQEWKGKNLSVIPNPVALNFSESVKPKPSLNVVLSVGRFSPEKRYHVLLKLWSKIVKQQPEWKLKIYGEGNKSLFNHFLKKLDIENSVELNEPIKDIAKIYEQGKLYLSASSSESFGLSMAEALSFKLPVVAFDTDGSKELITNGKNGYLIKQNDSADFVNKVTALMNDKALLETMKTNTKNGLDKYDLNKIMEKWIQLFQSI